MADWWNPLDWFSSSGSSSGLGAFAPSDTGGVESGSAGSGYGAFAPSNTGGVNAGGAQSFGDWLMSKEGAAALQSAGDKLKGPESGAKPPDPRAGQAQLGGGSQVVPGNSGSIINLLQMLAQRRYSPIGYSGGSGGGSTRGLLGY